MNQFAASHVLIVDENKEICITMAKIFKEVIAKESHVVHSFKDAQQLINTSAKQYFVAIVGLKLPDSMAFEVVDFMISKGMPVILLIENMNDDIRSQILDRNIIDYIIKTKRGEFDYLECIVNRIYKNKSLKALVVDDSKSMRGYLKRLLENQCLKVFATGDGLEALEILKSNPDISLVVTDYNMPRMDGLGLITEIRKKYSRNELAIVALSADGEELLSAKLLKNGANDFLAKPFIAEEFNLIIMQTISAMETVKELWEISYKDFLTGLNNRRYFFENAPKVFERARRGEIKATALMIDIDHFKKFNDTYGHETGDMVLIHISKIIKSMTKNSDIISSRMGGEEFCILTSGNDYKAGIELGEKLRKAIESEPMVYNGLSLKVTISIGVCAYIPDSLDEMLSVADKALYTAKRNGRNRMHYIEESQRNAARIVIIDDDKETANSIQRVLRRAGYETFIALSGFEAGVLLEDVLPNVITLDLMMPKLDGEKILSFIRRIPEYKSMKILIISGKDNPEVERLKHKGADDFLAKPFENEALLKKISDLIEI